MQTTTRPLLKIGITGKQNILPSERNNVYDRIKTKIEQILRKHNTSTFAGYTSMAKGADTLFAEVVTKEFNQPLKIILPIPVEEYKNNFKDPEDLKIFDNWIKGYGVEEVIDNNDTLNHEQKNEAYRKTGKFLADNCNEIIVVWDKSKPSGHGTTADILGMIASNGSKQDAILTNHDLNIIEINPVDPDAIHKEISHQIHKADAASGSLKRKYNIAWRSSIILGWLAAVCFATYTAFSKESLSTLLTITEFILVVAVIVIIRISKKKKYHFGFIFQRLKAEKLRLIDVFYNANFKIKLKELRYNNDAELTALIDRANDEIEKVRYSSALYSFYCINKLIEDQLSYHRSLLKSKIAKRTHLFETIVKVITALFLLNLFAAFLNSIVHRELLSSTLYSVTVFLSIFLPACFGGFEAWGYFTGWDILKNYSESMKEDLERIKLSLKKNTQDSKKLEELLTDTSVRMLTDNKNWDSIIRGKPEEVKLF